MNLSTVILACGFIFLFFSPVAALVLAAAAIAAGVTE